MILKRLMSIILSLIMCLVMIVPTSLHATSFSEASNHLSITVEYKHEGEPASGVAFSLYRVADMTPNLEFTWSEAFIQFEDTINLENLDSSGWKETAETLASYIQYEQILPYAMQETNSEGLVTFNEEGSLRMGLYLLMAETHSMNGRTYSVLPTLVCLPNRGEENTWSGDVVIHPKYSDIGEASSVEVIKQWNEDGDQSKRPASITVVLMKNDLVVDTIELSDKNNWRYRWDNLETGYEWKAVEKDVPEGYQVSISKQGTTLIIKNTLKDGELPPELDDTGVLWWPVPILFMVGIVFVLIGILLNKKSGMDNES